MRETPKLPARIEPDRKWFGNTRAVDQRSLESLRKVIEEQKHDTYSLLLKKRKIPLSLVAPIKNSITQNKLIDSFQDTFGKNKKRTKPILSVYTLEELAQQADKQQTDYDIEKDNDLKKLIELDYKEGPEAKFSSSGQSKRIYAELHKVIDSSDVIIEVLDARDPMGTRAKYVENFIQKNCPQKHIIIILNKCDLIPTWATIAWVKLFSKEYPTLAFHASITNPFGKPALFQLVRQFDSLHKEKKNISIGFIGYPNVGKSSIINTLKKKSVCRAAPIPGETKVWQYVALTKRIYLIDCTGVVYDPNDTDTDKALKGTIRVERIQDATIHISAILEKAKKEYLIDIYGIQTWTDYEDYLTQLGHKFGKLQKGSEPNLNAVSKILIQDWQRGKIPYFVSPPINKENEETVPNYNIKQDLDELKHAHKFIAEDLATTKA